MIARCGVREWSLLPDDLADNAAVETEWLMGAMVVRRSRKAGSLGLLVLVFSTLRGTATAPVRGGLGSRHLDPAQIVPLDQIAPEHRETVSEVIRDHTFHRLGEADSFPCPGNLYLSLLNEPLVPLSLWKDLSASPVQLQKVGPNRYEGTDGSGSTAVWDFVLRSPRLHVMVAYFNYVSPHGTARVEARIVLVVHSSYARRRQQRALGSARRGSLREGRFQGLEGPGTHPQAGGGKDPRRASP